MAYCTHCGSQIPDNSKFCPKCGATAKQERESSSKRKIVYDGEIHKCPNCGEILNAFSTKCPSCGYEVRGANASATVQNFAAKIGNATTEEQKVGIVRSYPVPNNKEDILDFMILASSNIGTGRSKEVYDAWVAKFEQAYQKANLLYATDHDFPKFKQIYDETIKKINKVQLARGVKKAGKLAIKVGPVLPQVIVTSTWIISILILIPLTAIDLDEGGTNPLQFILILDYLGGAIVMPYLINCGSPIPGSIVTIGLLVSAGILFPMCRTNLDEAGFNAQQLILFIEAICCAIMFARIVKQKSSHNENSRK